MPLYIKKKLNSSISFIYNTVSDLSCLSNHDKLSLTSQSEMFLKRTLKMTIPISL